MGLGEALYGLQMGFTRSDFYQEIKNFHDSNQSYLVGEEHMLAEFIVSKYPKLNYEKYYKLLFALKPKTLKLDFKVITLILILGIGLFTGKNPKFIEDLGLGFSLKELLGELSVLAAFYVIIFPLIYLLLFMIDHTALTRHNSKLRVLQSCLIILGKDSIIKNG